MDWTDTLNRRQSGHEAGFLASNIPLEDQDQALGGVLVEDVVDTEPADALDAMTKAELVAEADRVGVELPPGANKADIVALLRGE